MGKKSLYHPVSLNVIRGAFEYCGFNLGRVRQKVANYDKAFAVYTVELTNWPKDFFKGAESRKFDLFMRCLPREIIVIDIISVYNGETKKRTVSVNFETRLNPPDNNPREKTIFSAQGESEPVGEFQDLSWLVDDKGFGKLEADAYIVDQRAQRPDYDIPF